MRFSSTTSGKKLKMSNISNVCRFFFYIIEMRNMDKERKLRTEMNPMCALRVPLLPKGDDRELLCPTVAENAAQEVVEESEVFRQVAPGQFVCLRCGRPYKQLGSLQSHLRKVHGIQDEIIYSCSRCNASHNTQKQLTRHQEKCSQN